MIVQIASSTRQSAPFDNTPCKIELYIYKNRLIYRKIRQSTATPVKQHNQLGF